MARILIGGGVSTVTIPGPTPTPTPLGTPRAAGLSLRNAAPNGFIVRYKTNINNPARFFQNYRNNIATECNALGSGNITKMAQIADASGIMTKNSTNQDPAFGDVNDLLEFQALLNLDPTNTRWHQFIAPFQQGSFLNNATSANFVSRCSFLFAQAQSVVPEYTTKGVDVINEVMDPSDPTAYNRRLFKPGFPFNKFNNNFAVPGQIFAAARAQMPNADLCWLEIGHGFSAQAGLVTPANQPGTAGRSAVIRRGISVLNNIIEILDQVGPVVDVFGGQFHFRAGDYFNYEWAQGLSAECATRGLKMEYTEVDLSERNTTLGGGGNLTAAQAIPKFASALETVYNANKLSNDITFWENPPDFEINHDYLVSPSGSGAENNGELAEWARAMADDFLALLWDGNQRPQKGVFCRILTEGWQFVNGFCGFINTGSWPTNFTNLNAGDGGISNGQVSDRIGLRCNSGNTLRLPTSYIPFAHGTRYSGKFLIKRSAAGNDGVFAEFIENSSGDRISFICRTDNRVQIQIVHDSTTNVTIDRTLAANEELKLTFTVTPSSIVAFVDGVRGEVAAPTGGMPNWDRFYLGCNNNGSNNPSWHLYLVTLYEDDRPESILEFVSESAWGEKDPFTMLDHECAAAIPEGFVQPPQSLPLVFDALAEIQEGFSDFINGTSITYPNAYLMTRANPDNLTQTIGFLFYSSASAVTATSLLVGGIAATIIAQQPPTVTPNTPGVLAFILDTLQPGLHTIQATFTGGNVLYSTYWIANLRTNRDNLDSDQGFDSSPFWQVGNLNSGGDDVILLTAFSQPADQDVGFVDTTNFDGIQVGLQTTAGSAAGIQGLMAGVRTTDADIRHQAQNLVSGDDASIVAIVITPI